MAGAQTDTNTTLPGPGEISADGNLPTSNAPATNAPTTISGASQVPDTVPAPVTAPAPPSTTATSDLSYATVGWTPVPSPSIIGALLAFASLGGFLLYQCGLTRAKNSGHTSTLLLLGVLFALTGYWIGGFAVQTGGIGDAHAALAQAIPAAEKSALDHELGPVAFGHHWGLMGSAGFFLATDDPINGSIAALFLMQAALMAIAVAAALGATLERGQLRAMTICAFIIGVLIYPFFANWVWGGGWLAELGREFGLGHGFVDLGGAAVVHETAGTLALVLAVVLGPRHGRFGRDKIVNPIPGHNVPFLVLGSIILLVSWMATNAFASGDLSTSPTPPTDTASLVAAMTSAVDGLAVAATNTLLAAVGGLVLSFLQASSQKRRPEPARLCRGLLGGAVAGCGGAGLVDPWAAFLVGVVAGLLVQGTMNFLERKRIDDPVGATAVHGVGGAWGAIAVGLFANGTAGYGLNGVTTSGVRGLFFGGAWHQLAAQVLGAVTCFVVVYVLGFACVSIVQKIVGLRVDLKSETGGLDQPEVGALGYQGDVESEG
jgi:Amt family ammonium transporter